MMANNRSWECLACTFAYTPHELVRLTQRARGPGFDIGSSHILSFLLPQSQEGQLSVTSKSMCTKYWLTTKEV